MSSSWGLACIVGQTSPEMSDTATSCSANAYSYPRSMSRLAPVAKPFWSRGCFDMLPLPPPPRGGTGQAAPVAFLIDVRSVAIHCLSSAALCKFRLPRLVFLLQPLLVRICLVAACCFAVRLTYRVVQFCLVDHFDTSS